MDAYQILGHQLAQALKAQDQAANMELLADALATGDHEVLGAFDWTQLVNAGAEAVNKGIQYKQEQDTSNAAKAAATAAAAKSIAADANWAAAEQQLELAAHDPSQTVAATALQQAAMSAAMSAGAALTPDAQSKRAAAAQDASNKAAQASLAAPHDAMKAALMHGWQKVLAGVAAGGGGSGGGTSLMKHDKSSGGGSWLTAKHAGLPGWGWLIGGAVGGTALVLILKKLFG